MKVRPTILAALCILVLSACMPVAAPVAPPQAGSAAIAVPTGEAALSADAAEGAARLNPDALRQYLARTEVRIDALSPEETLQAWTIVEMRANRDAASPAVSLTVQDLSESADGATTDVILAGGDVYLRGPQDPAWLKFPRSDSTMILGRMLGPEELAEMVENSLPRGVRITPDEQIAGIQTAHYRFTGEPLAEIAARTFAQGGRLVSGQLDLWVAPEGYLKQVIQDLEIEEATGARTRHQMTMLVLEENQLQTIAIPPPDAVREIELPAAPSPEPADASATPGAP